MLRASNEPLVDAYDVAMLDLDGVVYVGADAVPGAPEALATARERGLRLAYVTNNASRSPQTVADHLTRLGVSASVEDVVTSAQAAARVLRERLGDGARVACLGASGLEEALSAAGLVPVAVGEAAAAIATGYGPDLPWRDIMRAAVRIRDGLPWVASNTDMTIPTDFGTAPGHGVLVEMLRRFADVEPVVAGKPSPPLLEETVRRTAATRPLMVGDRLDTDIAGGHNVKADTLLVLTGVSGLREIVSAREGERPTYIGAGLAGLLEPHPAPETVGGKVRLGGWSAGIERGRMSVEGEGSVSDWWRVVAAASWAYLDDHGEPATTDGLVPPREEASIRSGGGER